jgi:hypothetical protein
LFGVVKEASDFWSSNQDKASMPYPAEHFTQIWDTVMAVEQTKTVSSSDAGGISAPFFVTVLHA